MHPVRVPALLGVVLLLLMACGGGGQPAAEGGARAAADEGGLVVVATTTVLADVARQVVGGRGEVVGLLEAGTDPHDVALSARQVEQALRADVLLVNGGGLEQGLDDTVERAREQGVLVLTATDSVEPLPLGEAGHDHAEDGVDHAEDGVDHTYDGVDPHFWQDPGRTAAVAETLGAQLAALRGDDAFEASGREVGDRLRALADEVAGVLDAVPDDRRVLVTNHASFAYFAEAFDFDVAATVLPATTDAEPSAADLSDVVEQVERAGVPAVFAETVAPDRLARAVAAEVGRDVEVVTLHSDSLGEPGSGAETYEDLVRTNADRVAGALAG